jgi:hypothetical protein
MLTSLTEPFVDRLGVGAALRVDARLGNGEAGRGLM